MTGTPGYLPQDLIDFDADALDRGVVALTADRGLSEPLRLGPQEGLTVLAALAALRGMVEASDMNPDTLDALDRLVRKVAFPLGELAQAIDVRFQPTVSAQVLSEVQRAITRGVCVDIEYLDFSERRSVRRVEPWALFNDGDAFYLSGWCVTSDGERVFRVDRMTRVVHSEVPVTHPVGDRPDSAAPRVTGSRCGCGLMCMRRGWWRTYPQIRLLSQMMHLLWMSLWSMTSGSLSFCWLMDQ